MPNDSSSGTIYWWRNIDAYTSSQQDDICKAILDMYRSSHPVYYNQQYLTVMHTPSSQDGLVSIHTFYRYIVPPGAIIKLISIL